MLRPWRDLGRAKHRPISAPAWKRLDSTCWVLFRALDRMDLVPAEIPQRLIRKLFELDADYAEALWALDQSPEKLDLRLMLGDTLAALEQLPKTASQFRNNLPRHAHPALAQLEITVRR